MAILGGSHGFVSSRGAFLTLDAPVPYAVNTETHGINARQQIVGSYYNALTGAMSGFAYFGGTYTSLAQCSQADYAFFEPLGIKFAGAIVGTQLGSGSDKNYHYRGFVRGGYTCAAFDLPNAQGTKIYGDKRRFSKCRHLHRCVNDPDPDRHVSNHGQL